LKELSLLNGKVVCHERIRETAGRVGEQGMKWTTEKPTRSGYYFYRRDDRTIEEIIEVFGLSFYETESTYKEIGKRFTKPIHDLEGEFLGPVRPEDLI